MNPLRSELYAMKSLMVNGTGGHTKTLSYRAQKKKKFCLEIYCNCVVEWLAGDEEISV